MKDCFEYGTPETLPFLIAHAFITVVSNVSIVFRLLNTKSGRTEFWENSVGPGREKNTLRFVRDVRFAGPLGVSSSKPCVSPGSTQAVLQVCT